jgi:hypothetical protein
VWALRDRKGLQGGGTWMFCTMTHPVCTPLSAFSLFPLSLTAMVWLCPRKVHIWKLISSMGPGWEVGPSGRALGHGSRALLSRLIPC